MKPLFRGASPGSYASSFQADERNEQHNENTVATVTQLGTFVKLRIRHMDYEFLEQNYSRPLLHPTNIFLKNEYNYDYSHASQYKPTILGGIKKFLLKFFK